MADRTERYGGRAGVGRCLEATFSFVVKVVPIFL